MGRSAIRLFAAGCAVLALFGTGWNAWGVVQLQPVPGNFAQGEQVLSRSGCLNCHSLHGKGGTQGPDLSIPSRTAATPALFASSLWNHFPSMLSEFQRSNAPTPTLTSRDASDLFAYLYATQYFSPRGNSTRGGSLFVQKGCANCHSEILNTQRKPSLNEGWMDLKDPSTWAERMWNHAAEMDTAVSNRGMRWPSMSEQDFTDVMLFLSTRPGAEQEQASFAVGEADAGQAIFDEACVSCHTLGRSEKSKVDLLSRRGPATVTGYIASMWNHVPAMRSQGGVTPKLKTGSMPDLIAFLFSSRYFLEPGNADRGKRLYESKNCSACHETRRRELGAPDLTRPVEAFSPVTLTAAAWNHGTSMMTTMRQQGLEWPEFKGREMADLIAYLNSRLVVRIASPTAEKKD